VAAFPSCRLEWVPRERNARADALAAGALAAGALAAGEFAPGAPSGEAGAGNAGPVNDADLAYPNSLWRALEDAVRRCGARAVERHLGRLAATETLFADAASGAGRDAPAASPVPVGARA
jgi:hypothetical protein